MLLYLGSSRKNSQTKFWWFFRAYPSYILKKRFLILIWNPSICVKIHVLCLNSRKYHVVIIPSDRQDNPSEIIFIGRDHKSGPYQKIKSRCYFWLFLRFDHQLRARFLSDQSANRIGNDFNYHDFTGPSIRFIYSF